jgi:hypothetical protein
MNTFIDLSIKYLAWLHEWTNGLLASTESSDSSIKDKSLFLHSLTHERQILWTRFLSIATGKSFDLQIKAKCFTFSDLSLRYRLAG